jgi:hypothetical protein
MAVLRLEHSVKSFDAWKHAFDNDPADRAGSGVRRYDVLRSVDDPDFVAIDLEFDTPGEAERFLEKVEQVWAGRGGALVQAPRGRIFESVEFRELAKESPSAELSGAV